MPPFLPRKRLRSVSPEVESSSTKTAGKGKERGKAAVSTPQKRTLFETLDAGATPNGKEKHPKIILAKLAGSDSDSSELSSLSESGLEFEDIPNFKRQKTQEAERPEEDEDEDEDIEFEDVHTHLVPASAAPPPSGDLDLTLTKETRISVVNPHGKKQGPSKIERGIRVATHQMHVIFLMWHNAIRNSWISDKEVQSILVSQLGPGLKQEIERWRALIGLKPLFEVQPKESGKDTRRKGKGKTPDVRSQRDWGQPAEKQDAGVIDRVHAERLFRIVRFLAMYWRKKFRVTEPGLKKMGYMSLQRIDEEIKSFQTDEHDSEVHGERIADIKEFRERAKVCEGSRDLSAQLFTALLRGIGLEARIVVSLQPVGFGWSKGEEAASGKKNRNSTSEEKLDDDGNTYDEEVKDNESPRAKSNGSKRKVKADSNQPTKRSKDSLTRKSSRRSGAKDLPIDLSESDMGDLMGDPEEEVTDDDSVVDVTPAKPRGGVSKPYEKDLTPNYWSEVLSPFTNTYVPCSTLLHEVCATNSKLHAWFEPRGAKADQAKQVMTYIVGFSPDGTAKDVTVRYLKNHMWPGRTKGFRMPIEKVPVYNRHGKVRWYEEFDWFKTVMSGYAQRDDKRTEVDDAEDAGDLKPVKPERKEAKDGEETLQSYKSSAEFVLERHLRREEALPPGTQHVKMFTVKGKGKGDEATIDEKVFLRKDVVKCKSVETWHKEGRAPVIGQQPMKRVPYRAATTNRKRELAEAEAASGGEKMLQGLYSWDQTDWIIPPPIQNGVIPKNSYGNMDVYVPSMVPVGAVHIPRRGTMKICKRLGIDFAEAVTGFEFGARMAIPVITGVVVAEENVEMVIEQWKKDEAERVRKEDDKRMKAALGMWRKFLMGLRIVERVREEYGDEPDSGVDVLNPWINRKKTADKIEEETQSRLMDQQNEDMAGGFFPEGHVEEELPQSFFPTRHDGGEDDDDDEDGGGGFIVEGHKPTKHAPTSYIIPTSMQSTGRVQINESGGTNEDEVEPPMPGARRTRDTPSVVSRKANSRSSIAPKTTRGSKASGRSSAKSRNSKTTTSKGRNVKKAQDTGDGGRGADASDSLSSLSDLKDFDSGQEKERSAAKSGRRRATNKADGIPAATRAVPKRGAARRSDAALRSHYFEQSNDDEDDDDDDDGDGESDEMYDIAKLV
ncbi:MAG: hypothetical protein M1818_006129 [Claussenomyces sp. TS43310]|nr:MAG: hypothetical protein M1818_006129 [Claussenomyces sp. TS43310]